MVLRGLWWLLSHIVAHHLLWNHLLLLSLEELAQHGLLLRRQSLKTGHVLGRLLLHLIGHVVHTLEHVVWIYQLTGFHHPTHQLV